MKSFWGDGRWRLLSRSARANAASGARAALEVRRVESPRLPMAGLVRIFWVFFGESVFVSAKLCDRHRCRDDQ